MLSLRNKSVNVSRLMLIEKLKENLTIHKQQYEEAISDYRLRVKLELQQALKKLEDETFLTKDIPSLKIDFSIPVNHENEYLEVIEMLSFSVDETINLDYESFKAYVKNEWSWSNPFNTMMAATKSYISGAV